WDTPDGLRCWWVYSTALFEAATIERMTAHFQTLLASILANPDQRLSELTMMPAAEHAARRDWNATRAALPAEPCIHQLFEAQVARTPDAIAAAFEDEQWSYRELNRRAN